MNYIRPLGEAEVLPTGHPGLEARMLSWHESAMIFGATVCDGGRAAGLHYHHRDQIYFQLNGTLTARLGNEVQRIGPRTLVYIPAGLAHCNWNEGPGDESHLEIIAPATQIGAPLAFMVDSPDQVPPEWTPRVPATIVKADPSSMVDGGDGECRQRLIDPATNAVVAIDYVERRFAATEKDMVVHQADKHYFVLAGSLELEIAAGQHDVGPDTLVSLPAGVPHRIATNGSEPTTYLELTTATEVAVVAANEAVRVIFSHSR